MIQIPVSDGTTIKHCVEYCLHLTVLLLVIIEDPSFTSPTGTGEGQCVNLEEKKRETLACFGLCLS